MRAVIDAGVLVSALIRPKGRTGAIIGAILERRFIPIYSTDMLIEVIGVLGRDKFRTKYHIQEDDITALINLIRLRGELVIPTEKVNACRDPKDNKFLEAAQAGEADCIVSGDADLLDLGSFKKIPVLRPAEFITRVQRK